MAEPPDDTLRPIGEDKRLIQLSKKDAADIRKSVSAALIDPTTPIFRDIAAADAERVVICGEVNGKNRLGAYAGFRRFLIFYDKKNKSFADLEILQEEEDATSRHIKKTCKSAGL